MKRQGKLAIIAGVLFTCIILLMIAADYFNVFTHIGLQVLNLNLDFLSIVIGNGIVILLFIVAYVLIDSRNIAKESNKRRTALVILKNTYAHCIEMVERFSDDFTRKHAVENYKLDEGEFTNKIRVLYRTVPFADNNDAIVGFMQDGILSKGETETYFEVKRKYASYIELSIIYWRPADHVSTKGLEKRLLSMIRTALDEIEGELTRDND